MNMSACWRRLGLGNSNRISAPIANDIRRFAASAEYGMASKSSPQAEALERRVLLSAYSLTSLGTFGANATGASPRSTLVADGTGNLYGTAVAGGAYGQGTVFEIATGSVAITTIASFGGGNGAAPASGVAVDASGNLYGTTTAGGTNPYGMVFEIASGSNAITALASFNGTNGYSPQSVTLDASGDLIGATSGGPSSGGTVFEIASGSNAITTVAVFKQSQEFPDGKLALDASGNLYGTTQNGGTYGVGTVFEIASGSITIRGSFSGANGAFPQSGITLDQAGNLYGTTSNTAFKVGVNSNAITTIATFTGPNGNTPEGPLLMDPAGNLYGTTYRGGTENDGTVFEIANGSSAITTLASFDGTNGAYTFGGVTMNAAGNLFGTTYEGGAFNDGTVFEITKGSNAVTSFTSFDENEGSPGSGGVALDASGTLYGITGQGGTSNDGTVFEIAAGSSTATALASFNGTDGSSPDSIILDHFGNLFGATFGGGAYGKGAVFEIAHGSNTITAIASFPSGNGPSDPVGAVTLDAAGNLYGTTVNGVYSGQGAVFEVAKGSNAITALASFPTASGQWLEPRVTSDASGNLYGTTETGGPNNSGAIFEITKATGTLTVIATFNGANGSDPSAGVTLDSVGDLYGTTYSGGANGDGTVFEIPNGSTTITAIASFDGTNGSDPYTAVTLDPAGNLYGTTMNGGAYNDGTVFEIPSRSSEIISVLLFNGTNGKTPQAALTPDTFGSFYGATTLGGVGGLGTVFRLSANTTAAMALARGSNPSSSSQTIAFTATVTGGVPDGEAVTLVDATNNDAVAASGVLSNGSATLDVPGGTLAVGTHSLIAVYGGDANFAASESAPFVQTVNSDPLPSYIAASAGAAFGYNSVTGALNLTGGTLTFTADNATAPLIKLTASGPASGVFFDTSEHLAGLTLSGGAQATALSLGSARTHSNHNVLVIGTPGSANDPTFSIDASSKLDLTDNDLIVHTGSSDNGNGVPNQLGVPSTNELGTVRALALRGRNVAAGSVLNGTWTGNELASSSAAGVDAKAGYEQNVLAVVQNSDQILGKLSSWTVGPFSEPLGSNDIIVKYTYNGDAALEGYVGDDSVTIVNGFYDGGKSAQNDWAFGDFTGDGKVDDNDVTILNGLYGLGTTSSGLAQL